MPFDVKTELLWVSSFNQEQVPEADLEQDQVCISICKKKDYRWQLSDRISFKKESPDIFTYRTLKFDRFSKSDVQTSVFHMLSTLSIRNKDLEVIKHNISARALELFDVARERGDKALYILAEIKVSYAFRYSEESEMGRAIDESSEMGGIGVDPTTKASMESLKRIKVEEKDGVKAECGL